MRNVSVWLPEGYDANRATPYPTFYISHGGGGNDTDWMTQGMVQNIVGNAIRNGYAQDMVVVAPNFNGLPGGNVGLAQEIRDSIVPMVERQYNVSREAKDRALAGLSMGGARAVSALHEATDVFGYYAIWSPAGAYVAPTDEQLSRMREVLGLQIGAGVQDYLGNINTGTQNRINEYRALGLEVVDRMIPGIHSWDYWRGALDEFVKDVAFKKTATEITPVIGAKAWLPVTLSATVASLSTSAVAPTGTVTFYVGSSSGEKLGVGQVAADGAATISTLLREVGPATIVAVYSGDELAGGSVGELAIDVASGPVNPLRLGPTVARTDTAPTGHEVTFRYQAPTGIELVRIYGEWSFTNPASMAANNYVADYRAGANWRPGDVPAGTGWNGGWPTWDMTLVDAQNRIWEFTTPLPAGTFSYRYSVCTGAGGTGCTNATDPANVPWSNTAAGAGSSAQSLSQVYVPESSAFPSEDLSFQAPPAAADRGTLSPVTYESSLSGGARKAVVWLPPNYDPARAEPYPTLYLSHGGGGNETDWATQGVAQNILANAIADGRAKDMVLVLVTYVSLTGGNADASAILLGTELKDSLIPWIESHYNVSTRMEDRALAGLSQGGMAVSESVATNPGLVGYVGVWSPKDDPNAAIGGTDLYNLTEEENGPGLRSPLVIQLGAGTNDRRSQPANFPGPGAVAPILADTYRSLGANVIEQYREGVHSWDVWRWLLNEFISSVAFKDATPPAPVHLGPTVSYTGEAPTGYEVTFRYEAPDSVSSVRIKGEWSFGNADGIAADQTNPNPHYGSTWEAGDFPLSAPNVGSAANWPVADLVKNPTTGVWEYTTQLPAGTYTYAFYLNCNGNAPSLSGCSAQSDPANPPWSTAGSSEPNSQVYVPTGGEFDTGDLSWQDPNGAVGKGTVTHVIYGSPGHTNPNGVNYATIYTPPGYDPAGGVEYPTFYLVHGGGGNEMDWSTQGAAKAILDNLISSGQAQPMVVVMPNNPTTADLLGNLIPYVESHYAVSTDPQWRAYAGLSGGATTVQDILFHRTSTFGYYAVWSAPRGAPTQAEAANPALKELLGLQVGVAIQDLGGAAQANTTLEQQLLDDAGVSYRKYNTNGGHNWAWWREAMGDFVTEVAFRDAGVTVAAPAGVRQNALTTVRATVAPLAASVVPTGTVTFTADGAVLGVADIAADGVAAVSVVFPQSGSVELKAAYSGDALFDPAETTSAITVAAGNPNPLNLGPTIRYTGTGPTGYAATIRYQAPAGVTSVSIYGEWAFAQPEDIRSKFDADWHMGDDWRPGDTVGQAGVWPSTPMVQGPDGVWEYTTALPAGVFSYGFLHNCQTQGGSCMQQPDPYNVPWSNLPGMADLGVAAQRMSQIVVPTSTLFPTPDFSFAQAVATGTGGTLVPIRYNSPASTSPAGQHNLVVYLPPGYDQSRAKPYPTLYLSHGGSGSESDWATQGLAQNILDNAINSGAAEPMVVVMPNFNGLPNGNSGLYQEIRDNVIPLIEARYNVSTSPDDRAMAGLSAGGARTAMALHEQASLFEYYGIWSGGGFYAPPADNQWSAMTQVTAVHISTGTEDWQNYPINEQSYLRAADYAEHGVPVVEWNVHGIHSWDVWRQDLNDFIRNVVFQGAPTAPVAPVTTPVVSHTGVGPTGYEVTVRLYAPGADQVEIYGEWAFTQADGTSLAPSHDGNGWVPGEIPAGGSWWWASMTDPDGDGVWTYTVPLPPGVFSYGLYVDCPARTLSCRIADPSNVPWANGDVPQAAGATTQVMSQVYVPTDPEFSSEDYSYQAVRVGPKGVLTALRYFSPESTSPVGSHQAVVYTPPGYDPDRVEPYPTLYLSHGGGGNETDWAAQGRANVILDNAINAGEAAPMVVVMTNFNGLPNGNDGYRADLIGRVIPAIEAAYNVSTDPADRAFAGLSAGGSRAFNILLSQAEEFGYFGIWSSGGSAPDLTADQVAKIRGLGGIQFSAGLNENAGLTMPVRAAEYEAAVPGLDIAEYYVPGVHAWAVWRQSLNDFIRNHAFKDTPDQPTTPVTSQALEALANVAGALNEDLYTQASWAALQGAVSSAQAALSNPNATQGDIDAAAAALSGAIAGLIPAPTAPPGSGAGDSGPLSALVTGVSTLRAESYSQATWAALQAALTGARAVTANPASTQAELNAALAALNAALAALAPAPTPAPTQSSPAPSEPGVVDPGPVVDAAATLAAKTALGSVVTQAESLVSGGYTAESWAALQTVLSAAKAIGGDPAAGAAQAQAAIVQLSKALAGLVAQAPAPVTGPEGSVATVSLVKAGQRAVVLAKGQKITIAALAYTDTGAKATVRWSSSAKSVATVSSTGMITAKKAGKATITIRAGAKNTTLKVTVLAKKPSATVKKVTATVPKTLRVGDSGTVIPTYSPARVAKVKVTYTSANPDVVSVDKTGRLLAKQAGTAKISVKAGGKTKVYTVVVS
ncbi:MAG: Ig-like domain repeat protein [Bifidobacteriaceae bacterium]|jgi:enterochelin esterase-like enzyme|nr:Ig-like domain repeat protein [Bifidobacteriaceae bacterium]